MSRGYDDGFDDGYNNPPITPKVPRGAGTFLMISGSLSLLGGILTVIVILTAYDPFLDYVKGVQAKAQGQRKAEMAQQIKQMEESKPMSQTAYTVLGSISAVLGFIIMLAGNSMRKAGSYGFSMIGCILSFIPIANCCCVLTIPAGIVGLIALLNPNVKAAFNTRRDTIDNDYRDNYEER